MVYDEIICDSLTSSYTNMPIYFYCFILVEGENGFYFLPTSYDFHFSSDDEPLGTRRNLEMIMWWE